MNPPPLHVFIRALSVSVVFLFRSFLFAMVLTGDFFDFFFFFLSPPFLTFFLSCSVLLKVGL